MASTHGTLHMLYKFKSKSTGDVIMLEPNGARVLEIIGKASPGQTSRQGIVLPEQMPAAIAALQRAIELEDAARAAARQDAVAAGEEVPQSQAIALRVRAKPFIDMLRRCQRDGHEIVWGV